MTDKQQMVFDYVRSNGQITKQKAVELIGKIYYCNADKHVGDVLSRMVKAGLLKRIEPGLFELGDRTNKTAVPENQLDLFKH